MTTHSIKDNTFANSTVALLLESQVIFPDLTCVEADGTPSSFDNAGGIILRY